MADLFYHSYQMFRQRLHAEEMLDNTNELLKLELGQTFPCYHASAEKALALLKRYGIPNAEKITFPADGRTDYQDKITPLGWKATIGKAVIQKAIGIPQGTVIADYQRHPFHLIKGSVSTPPGGAVYPIITEAQMIAGMDARGAFVLLSPRTAPGASGFLSRCIDLGATGFISDYSMNAKDAPDGIQWSNAQTEHGNWHVIADDRPFIGFSITPGMGDDLRRALASGPVTALIESDATRYETTVDLVTALVPGRRKEEFWIFAHLYEPLGNDNSSGVAAAIETLRMIMAQGTPEFSLRVLFGLEHYGFAAYAAMRGDGNLSREVLGGIDYDAMYLHHGWSIRFNCAAPGTPFFGNYLFEQCANDLNGRPEIPTLDFFESYPTMYDDDSFLGDSTTGVPTLWPIRAGKNFWHNSRQTIDYVEKAPFAVGACINAAVVDAIVNPRRDCLETAVALAQARLERELAFAVGSHKEHLRRRYDICMQDMGNFRRFLPEEDVRAAEMAVTQAFERLSDGLADEIPHSPWRDLAERVTPSRLTTGFPFDLARVPFAQRRPLPGSVLYSPLAAILADMDGKRNLAQILRMVEHEIRRLMDENEIISHIKAIFYLAKWGYVSIGDFQGLGKDAIVAALRAAGIRQGDVLAVHSSVTNSGIIEGGAATLFEALREAVGPEGTFMAPSFTFCFANIGGPNTLNWYRPYDHENRAMVWTGALPRYMMGRNDVLHTWHPSHSWCIYGPRAQEIGGDQKLDDTPCGSGTPLMRMMRLGGKIVHFCSKLSSTTFLHCIEDALDLPGIQDTLCMLKTSGAPTPVAVRRNLPGCRDFYHGDETTIKFFVEAVKQGLEVRQAPMGLSEIKVMDMTQLWDIGCRIAKSDPFIFLCDVDKCDSCRRLKEEYEGRRKSQNV